MRAALVQDDGTALLFIVGLKMKLAITSAAAHRASSVPWRWLRTLPDA